MKAVQAAAHRMSCGRGHCSLEHELELCKKLLMADERNCPWHTACLASPLSLTQDVVHLQFTVGITEDGLLSVLAWRRRYANAKRMLRVWVAG